MSVKDISTLFYPRFELDERNSRRCYACMMKPYLYKSYILPCKVKKVMDKLDGWNVEIINGDNNENIISQCGLSCDDCASIFENDILYEIEKIIKKHESSELNFIIELEK